ncbi:MAG: hypothetical protein R3E01_13570 [Pirellulaceae bacterium]|nr:hypothetical protein [Bdellovibrionales bacterium]
MLEDSMALENIQLDAEDVVLLILEANERLLRKPSLNGITRLEKLLFLLERETHFEGIGAFFAFEPHNFGPFSKEVYEAIDFLDACELISVREKSYSSPYSSADERKLLSEISENDVTEDPTEPRLEVKERQFLLTENGRKVAQILREGIQRRKPSDVSELDSIVRKYGTAPLNQLIRYVYRQHPDMTVNSIHPEAQKL